MCQSCEECYTANEEITEIQGNGSLFFLRIPILHRRYRSRRHLHSLTHRQHLSFRSPHAADGSCLCFAIGPN